MLSAENKYIEEHSSPLTEALDWIEKQTNIRTNYPQMLCGKQKGRLLKMLVEILGAKNILEIGTFTGYSAVCLASGLQEGGHIDALEINDELEDLILEGWEKAGVSEIIDLHIANACDWMKSNGQQESYDLIYIDANKREYVQYFELAIELVRPGGLIVTDDVLMGGKVFDNESHDAQTLGLAAFNDLLVSSPRVETLILPLHDGLSIARKLL